jgi:hypothetical protein
VVAILSTQRRIWRKEEEGGAAELGDDGDRSQLSIASDSVLKRVVKERKAYSHPIHILYVTPFTKFNLTPCKAIAHRTLVGLPKGSEVSSLRIKL